MPRPRSIAAPVAVALLSVACVGLAAAGCAAVYPEVQTPLRTYPAGKTEGRLPADLKWVSVKRAKVPERTRDGRVWDSVGGSAPDPYVVVSVDGRPILRTPTRSNTLRPEWADSPAGHFRMPSTARVRVELWDTNPIKDRPIGIREITVGGLEPGEDGELEIECDSGAQIVLAWEAPRPKLGLGFSYELQTYDAVVTRVYEESPAAASGVRPGDRIVAVDHEVVRQMKEGELQTRLNVPRAAGVLLKVQRRDGSVSDIQLKDGPVYPLYDEVQAALPK